MTGAISRCALEDSRTGGAAFPRAGNSGFVGSAAISGAALGGVAISGALARTPPICALGTNGCGAGLESSGCRADTQSGIGLRSGLRDSSGAEVRQNAKSRLSRRAWRCVHCIGHSLCKKRNSLCKRRWAARISFQSLHAVQPTEPLERIGIRQRREQLFGLVFRGCGRFGAGGNNPAVWWVVNLNNRHRALRCDIVAQCGASQFTRHG